MILFSFIFLLLLQGISASQVSKNPVTNPRKYLSNILDSCGYEKSKFTIPGNKAELMDFCVDMGMYFSCYYRNIQTMPPHICGFHKLLINSEGLIGQLCSEDRMMHHAYLKYAACFRKMDVIYKSRDALAKELSNIFVRITEDKKFAKDLHPCLWKSQAALMVLDEVLNICGYEAKRIFKTMLDESSYISVYCTPQDYIISMRAAQSVLNALLEKKVAF